MLFSCLTFLAGSLTQCRLELKKRGPSTLKPLLSSYDRDIGLVRSDDGPVACQTRSDLP